MVLYTWLLHPATLLLKQEVAAMNRIFPLLLICAVVSVGYSAQANPVNPIGIGVKLSFVGGPLVSLVVSVELPDEFLLDLSLGGAPGILFRAEANLRYSFLKYAAIAWIGWRPYAQLGLGYVRSFRSNLPYNEVKEIHLSGGLAYKGFPALTLSADVGLLWAPSAVNPQVKEVFPNRLSMAPMVTLEAVYKVQG
jgi:hypothetical protein